MSKVEPHPHDEGKWQSAVDEYGHGPGNGKSRQAVYAHLRKSAPSRMEKHDETQDLGAAGQPIPIESDENDDWLSFDVEVDETPNQIPAPLKMLAMGGVRDPSKMTKKERETWREQNVNLLKLGLGGLDHLMSLYGKTITKDPKYVVKHSDSDKEITARAQYAYMEERGIDPGAYVGTGTVALALTGYYVVPPMVKIQRKSERKLLAGVRGRVGGFFGRFRRRRTKVDPDIEAVVEDGIE